jgi:hypothetical protein
MDVSGVVPLRACAGLQDSGVFAFAQHYPAWRQAGLLNDLVKYVHGCGLHEAGLPAASTAAGVLPFGARSGHTGWVKKHGPPSSINAATWNR